MRKPASDPRPRWWREVLLVGVLYELYELTSDQTSGTRRLAAHHAHQQIRVERMLGLFHERQVQHWFTGNRSLIGAADIYYTTIHFVLPVAALVWLLWRAPARYCPWRNALAWMTGISLACFALFPLMPPRLLPPSFGFVDTLSAVGGAGTLDSALMRTAGNAFSAMPSLHIGWALWCTFALVPVVRQRWIKALLVAHPVVTLFVVTVTANHFFLDVIGGAVVFGLGVGLAFLAQEFTPMTRLPQWARSRWEPSRRRRGAGARPG